MNLSNANKNTTTNYYYFMAYILYNVYAYGIISI